MVGGMIRTSELLDAQAVDAHELDPPFHQKLRGGTGQVDEVPVERVAPDPVVTVAGAEEDAIHARPVKALQVSAVDAVLLEEVEEPGGPDQVFERNGVDGGPLLLEVQGRVDMGAAVGAEFEARLVDRRPVPAEHMGDDAPIWGVAVIDRHPFSEGHGDVVDHADRAYLVPAAASKG